MQLSSCWFCTSSGLVGPRSMSPAKGRARTPGHGRGSAMDREEIELGAPDPAMIQVAAEETVRNSASATALAKQALPGVGRSRRASLPGDGQHWPPDGTPSRLASYATPTQAASPGRCDVLQQRQVHISLAKGGGSTNTTTRVARSPKPIDPVTNNPMPYQPRPIQLQHIPINLPLAIPRPLLDNRPLIECRLWRRRQIQQVWTPCI